VFSFAGFHAQFEAMDEETYFRGIKLFNSADYFEAHEVLEDVWRAAPQLEKRFFQGLIQVAVALHHHSQGQALSGATGHGTNHGGRIPQLRCALEGRHGYGSKTPHNP
jgi:hypothetical protein